LHAHFAEEVTIDNLAAAVGVHPTHLMRTFRRFHRCTVGEYLRSLRVEHACHLLSTSDAPLAGIALSTGFSDQSHFSHAFKRQKGMPPAAFRKESQQTNSIKRRLV
jgi:AraC family transcriptional regulator